VGQSPRFSCASFLGDETFILGTHPKNTKFFDDVVPWRRLQDILEAIWNPLELTVPCVLRAIGFGFAVDEFLAASSLRPITIFHRGEKQSAMSRPMTTSGFHADVSAANFSNLASQIADAVQFVERNRDELARLIGFPGVENVSVDFGIEERDVAAQSERFPPNLLRMLGNLGISLEFTLYPCQTTRTG